MYKIKANASGTRTIVVTEKHLETIQKYSLFSGLVDSNGIVDEDIVNKLRFNIRGLLESEPGKDKDLLDLCLDVIYNQNMKAIGLDNLVTLYKEWSVRQLSSQEVNNTLVTE
ncbi:hypothetical protein [Prevotella histicola]|uniref:Uncharacterized protein n=1 Tax=Prevotella histicola JCM 15637 = DNF00424 TaxID=1236504 RepID=A0AAW3FHB6_9BACT|nr:hypothetical protein [Prevotella histicola]KGF29112.1 hypothetical protein HMPREF2132_03065 [Prevotella histicola JCM 15637 = DNF00424]